MKELEQFGYNYKSQEKFDKSQPFADDKGFQEGENITTPHKRKPKRELSQQQKDENKALSSNRIFIEHLIRLLKIFRIASQRFRLKKAILLANVQQDNPSPRVHRQSAQA
jgi:hypothetical protein